MPCEAKHFTTVGQFYAFIYFRCKDINKDDLKANLLGQDWFSTHEHVFALDKLLSKGMSIDNAISQMSGLSNHQIVGIYCGLDIEDVVGLSDKNQMNAMLFAYKKGLNKQLLSDNPWFIPRDHVESLKVIISEDVRPSDAMSALKTSLDKVKNQTKNNPTQFSFFKQGKNNQSLGKEEQEMRSKVLR